MHVSSLCWMPSVISRRELCSTFTDGLTFLVVDFFLNLWIKGHLFLKTGRIVLEIRNFSPIL